MKNSPTQRSLRHLRALGYTCAVVEKWVQFPPPGHRVDLFGFIDILALKPGITLAIQACAGDDASTRLAKIHASKELLPVLHAGWQIHVHAWRKVGDRGKRKLWDLREIPVHLPLLRNEVDEPLPT